MMQAIKKLYNFVQQNLFCKIVTYFLVFAPIVICMEKGTSVKKGYINCINIFLVGVLILTYYSFLKDRHYYKQPLIYIFSGIIVFNRLYDIEAIGKKWNYSENILMIAGLVIVSAVLFLPEMGIFLCKKWKKKELNQEQLSVADLTEDGNLIHENKNQHTERMSNDKKTEEKKQYKNVNMMNDSEKNKAETDKMPLFLTAVIMLIMIIVPSGIYYYIVQGDVFSIVQKFKDQNISSNLISSIVSYIILVFIVGTYSILLGSIFGVQLMFSNNAELFVEGVMVVSTYGKKFVPSNDINKINQLKRLVIDDLLPSYQRMLETEMGMLYLRHLDSESCLQQRQHWGQRLHRKNKELWKKR